MRFFYIFSFLFFFTLINLFAVDECSNTEFITDINSTLSYSHDDTVFQQNNTRNDSDKYYINITEAGTATITITTANSIFVSYDENGCPSNSEGLQRITKDFISATDFNLLVYATEGNHPANYNINITFVSSENTSLIANNKTYNTDYETAISGNILTDQNADSDDDGDTITLDSFTYPSNGTLSVLTNGGDGSFTYTPNSGYSGVDSFTYIISDGNGATDAATIYLNVNTNSGAPEYQDDYSCGIFPSVLVSYTSIAAVQNDVFNSCVVSVKNYNLVEDGSHDMTCYTGSDDSSDICSCDPTVSECSVNETCTIIPEPINRYEHEFLDTNITGLINYSGNIEFTDLYYPSYTISKQGNNNEITFNPQSTYDDSTRKLMILGDIDLTSVGQVITFEEGDYYMNSLTLNNTPDLNINGRVRLFIKNDFIYSGNSMNVVNDGSIFLYVGGDITFESSGGGNGFLDMFFYVEGDATINANSNAASLFGGITAEGSIDITGNNMNFIYNEAGADAMGYGECKLCYLLSDENQNEIAFADLTSFEFNNIRNTVIINESGVELTDTNITQIEGTGLFSFGSTTYSVVDENDNAQVDDINSICSDSTTIAMVTTCNEYTTEANFGDYPSNGYTSYKAIQTDRTGFQFFTDSSFTVNALFNDSDKKYDVELEYCDISGSAVSDPVLGVYDSWDNSASDRNITTKVANKDFTLRIASIDDNRDVVVKTGINAQYQLYDYDTLQAITPWENFSSSTQSTIVSSFNIDNAYKNVRVRFQLCQENATGSLINITICNQGTAGYDYNTSIASVDNFAIRPDRFLLSKPVGEDINLLTSAKDYNLSLVAAQYAINTTTTDYSIENAQNILTTSLVKYNTDGSDGTATLNGSLSIVNTSSFNIEDGLSTQVGVNFTDIGKINIKVKDITWADVDINHDSTSLDCSADGAYICGDIDATFIPDHFTFSDVNLYNDNNNSNFTYLSNDLNISAHIGLTITAKNNTNGTTLNFDSSSWENPVDINFSVSTSDTPNLIKSEIDTTQNIGFSNGVKIISSDESNSSRNLIFNFTREINNALNPFVVNGSEVTLNASSTYGATTILGSSVADKNTTFLYGRTHASRQRFDSNSENTFIYYESFCFNTDNNSKTCDKSLLPNGLNSKSSSDIRWFINETHNATNDGIVGTISEKESPILVTSSNATTTTPSSVTLTYNENYGYPYKTTMENNASSWLLYNPYDSNASTNEFSVEFEGPASNWSGINETQTTTKDSSVIKSNRRSMW